MKNLGESKRGQLKLIPPTGRCQLTLAEVLTLGWCLYTLCKDAICVETAYLQSRANSLVKKTSLEMMILFQL